VDFVRCTIGLDNGIKCGAWEAGKMPSAKRHIDQEKKSITLEFTNGQTFGPIELNPVTDALTKMIGALEGRIAGLEAKTVHLQGRRVSSWPLMDTERD